MYYEVEVVTPLKLKRMQVQDQLEMFTREVEQDILRIKEKYHRQKQEIEELRRRVEEKERVVAAGREEVGRKERVDELKVSEIRDKARMLMDMIKDEKVAGMDLSRVVEEEAGEWWSGSG